MANNYLYACMGQNIPSNICNLGRQLCIPQTIAYTSNTKFILPDDPIYNLCYTHMRIPPNVSSLHDKNDDGINDSQDIAQEKAYRDSNDDHLRHKHNPLKLKTNQ